MSVSRKVDIRFVFDIVSSACGVEYMLQLLWTNKNLRGKGPWKHGLQNIDTGLLECVCKDTRGFFQKRPDFHLYLLNNWGLFTLRRNLPSQVIWGVGSENKRGLIDSSHKKLGRLQNRNGDQSYKWRYSITLIEADATCTIAKIDKSGADGDQMGLPWSRECIKARSLMQEYKDNDSHVKGMRRLCPDSINICTRWSAKKRKVVFTYGSGKRGNGRTEVGKMVRKKWIDSKGRLTALFFEEYEEHGTNWNANFWFYVPNKQLYKELQSLKSSQLKCSDLQKCVFFNKFRPNLSPDSAFLPGGPIRKIESIAISTLGPVETRMFFTFMSNTHDYKTQCLNEFMCWVNMDHRANNSSCPSIKTKSEGQSNTFTMFRAPVGIV